MSSVISQPVPPPDLANTSEISPSVVTVQSKLNDFWSSDKLITIDCGNPLTAPVELFLRVTPRVTVFLEALDVFSVLFDVLALPDTLIILFACNLTLAYK